jgi:hypothetical protein
LCLAAFDGSGRGRFNPRDVRAITNAEVSWGMAGYSGTPLAQKLGIKAGMTLAVLDAPDGYLDALELPEGAKVVTHARGKPILVQRFATRRARLLSGLSGLVRALPDNGALWICWPKGKEKAAIATDLDERQVRELGLSNGLVDVKVCAVDEIWSGLKFVRRVKDRQR